MNLEQKRAMALRRQL